MKPWFACLFPLILVACAKPAPLVQPAQPKPNTPVSSTPTDGQTGRSSELEAAMKTAYPDLGPAPQLEGAVWLNTDGPLSLSGLRGKVVLVDMWTFG
jgi:hypothetical protein